MSQCHRKTIIQKCQTKLKMMIKNNGIKTTNSLYFLFCFFWCSQQYIILYINDNFRCTNVLTQLLFTNGKKRLAIGISRCQYSINIEQWCALASYKRLCGWYCCCVSWSQSLSPPPCALSRSHSVAVSHSLGSVFSSVCVVCVMLLTLLLLVLLPVRCWCWCCCCFFSSIHAHTYFHSPSWLLRVYKNPRIYVVSVAYAEF